MGVEQPVDGGEAGALEGRVQDAVALEHPFPDEGDDHGGEEDGIEEGGAEEAAGADGSVQDEGGAQTEDDHQPDLAKGEPEGVPDAVPELVVEAGVGGEMVLAGEELAEIAAADEGAIGGEEGGAAGDGVIDVEGDGEEGEEAEDGEVGADEEPGEAVAEHALRPAHRALGQVHQGGEEAAHATGRRRRAVA